MRDQPGSHPLTVFSQPSSISPTIRRRTGEPDDARHGWPEADLPDADSDALMQIQSGRCLVDDLRKHVPLQHTEVGNHPDNNVMRAQGREPHLRPVKP